MTNAGVCAASPAKSRTGVPEVGELGKRTPTRDVVVAAVCCGPRQPQNQQGRHITTPACLHPAEGERVLVTHLGPRVIGTKRTEPADTHVTQKDPDGPSGQNTDVQRHNQADSLADWT